MEIAVSISEFRFHEYKTQTKTQIKKGSKELWHSTDK